MSAIRTLISVFIGTALGLSSVYAAAPLAADSSAQGSTRSSVKAAQDADIIRNLLVGEFALQSGDSELAWQAFLTTARKSRSAQAAQRAFDIAEQAANQAAAEQALEVWTQLDPNNRQVQIGQAEQLFSQGQYEKAGELIRSLVQQSDDPAGVLDDLSGMQQIAPEKDHFYRTFVKAAEDLQEDARAQLVLSSIAARARMTPQAAMHASKAMDLAPDSPHVVMSGIDAEFQNNPKKAILRIRDFLKRHPDSFELRLIYAKSLLRTGNAKELPEQLKTLEQGRLEDPHSLMLLGMIAEEGRLYEQAKLYYKRYLTLLGKNAKTGLIPDAAYVRLGMVELAQGNKQEAIGWLDRVEGGDKYEAARIKQAELLAENGDATGACRVLRGIRTPDAQRKMQLDVACAELLIKTKRADAAVDVLMETLASAPKNPELLYKTAILAVQQERLSDAEKLFERYIEENPEDPNGWNSLGYLWADRAVKLDKAESYLKKAMTLSKGKDAFILDSLGWLRYRQGRIQEAERLIRQAQYAQPSDTEITLHLAEILYVAGKTVEADSYIASVLEGEPGNVKARELRTHKGPAKQ